MKRLRWLTKIDGGIVRIREMDMEYPGKRGRRFLRSTFVSARTLSVGTQVYSCVSGTQALGVTSEGTSRARFGTDFITQLMTSKAKHRVTLVWTDLSEGVTSNRGFADTSEVEEALMLDDICDLRITLGRSVLEVVNYTAVRIESEHK